MSCLCEHLSSKLRAQLPSSNSVCEQLKQVLLALGELFSVFGVIMLPVRRRIDHLHFFDATSGHMLVVHLLCSHR